MTKSPSQMHAAAIFATLTGIFAASLLLPLPGSDGSIAHLPSLCPFYNITGLPCPGCGLTRAFVSLGHGQWLQSLHWHPLGWLIALVLACLWVRSGVYWLRGTNLWAMSADANRWLTWAGVVGLVVSSAGRIAWLTVHHQHF